MNKVIIIAEAGVNHNGDIQVAKKKLIDAAVNAGVDYVKFQTF
jgi:N-acetylneuraminate synthase/N,N'-diacetyllegionaminate synthase